ncbi:hypothetical protein LJB68_13980 [bacterium 210820-DFI.6.52]|uniref:Uncharacterized protein n=1 Tax=Bittarella massiliensis (ex Durand et al. 2017) TaxID=1720313 RepID=A0AAQ1RWZ0_9FIRM|nr:MULTISPECIES: hypothetical protein [Eubacteriales]ERJ00097.1 hypothetical protein HMPREF0262_01177 [Clostridium sp. ATCC 29733]MCB5942639.1 hypothetical protein [bacterium 210820-DFI.6.52]SHG50871.1 hypothetical protein SAMN05444424_2603 [Bittarella massiliensis (ex Durand et al. 2017)]
MAFVDKGKGDVPPWFEYGIFNPFLEGIREDAPDWAKQQYQEWLKDREEDKKTLTKF